MTVYHDMIRDQLDEGLRELHHLANQLMHEIASEVWRTTGGDKRDVQSKLIQSLSRDQAIRALIAHTDERFQTLAVRTARLEDTLNMVAEGMRQTREQIARSVDALGEVPRASDSGETEIRRRLDELTEQVALAFETLADRDRTITETVEQRVREHGELVANETARITRALESYVQQGVETMGMLAGSVEARLGAPGDEEIAGRLNRAVEIKLDALDDRLRAISERVGPEVAAVTEAVERMLETTDTRNRSLAEFLELMHDRVGMETREILMALEGLQARTEETARAAAGVEARQVTQTIETRIHGLAELVRSDSLALREELVRTAAEQDETLARTLDQRLTGVTDHLSRATDRMVDEIAGRIRHEALETIGTRLDEVLAAVGRRLDETSATIDTRLDEASAAIDRNLVRMSDTLEGQLDRLATSVGDRASEAADLAVRDRFADVLGQLQTSISRLEDLPARTEEAMGQSVDARIAALAKLVRSDNESLARQIVADQEASKQALRAMKELQASLPADVIETIQRRMDDLAESVAKSQEMLAQRIDRMAAKIGEQHESDIQIVVDRMGDAMHALASLGRSPRSSDPNGDRIDLE
ncbi:MAG TPA: hypothetical protein VFZ96_03345 [Actinomycetota bacterium]|nr:hypothetical protein [Actinomycetota bacterium]